MVEINKINELLKITKQKQDRSSATSKFFEIITKTDAANSTLFGDSDGQIIEGVFKCLVRVSDNPTSETTRRPVLTTIIKELPGIENKMNKPVSDADKATLDKIFGSSLVNISSTSEVVGTSITSVMNHELFCDGSPLSISDIIIKASGASAEEFNTTVKKLVTEDLQDVVDHAITQLQSKETQTIMTNALAEAKEKFTKQFGGLNSGDFLKDISENFSGELGSLIGNFGPEFTSGKTLQVLNAALGNINALDISAAITSIPTDILSKAGILGIGTNIGSLFDMQDLIGKLKLQAPEIKASLAELTNKIDEQITGLTNAKTTVAATINDNDTAKHETSNAETSVKENQFTILGSQQEIESILKTCERDLTTIVWHWTGHYLTDGDVGAPEINQEFLTNKETIPYHFVIRKNGSIQTGAPLNKETSHVRDEFKPLSFGVAFVAGYNGARGGPRGRLRLDSKSITQAQWDSFDLFMKAFYTIFPGGDAFGNNDLSIDDRPLINIGPGFNVSQKIIGAPFFRKNSADPDDDRKFLTRDEIIAKNRKSNDIELERQGLQ